MKSKTLLQAISPFCRHIFRVSGTVIPLLVFTLIHLQLNAVTKTSVATGNWSNGTTWSPSGTPASGDNVIIHGGNVVTIDGAYTCNNLSVGDATSGVTTLKITAGGNSLTVNGALSMNPNNVSNTYTLDAGPGSISISGTFPTWSATGTNTIRTGTGTLTFTPAISITSSNQNITFYGAGTVNFNSSFTDSYNKLITFAACTVNFATTYTVNTTFANWAGKGTAVFTGVGSSITATSNLTLYNVQTSGSATLSLASAAGTVIIGGAVTIGSGTTFTANENFELDGNWTNNGTFSGGSNTVYLNGAITVAGATAFPNLQMGNLSTTVTVSVTLNSSITCSSLTYTGYNRARTIIITTGDSLTVNGNVLINQPSSANTNGLQVNGGTCIITGNLTFSGTAMTASYISSVTVTSGSLSVSGTVSYDANTVAANQVITVSTGAVTFSSALSMAYGTLAVTSTGTINFRGSSPSFTFGGSNSPLLTTTAGCTLNFTNGFVNNTNALTLNAASNSIFTGNGTIIANAALTLGNAQFNGTDTLKSTGSVVGIAGNCTLSSGSTFNALQTFQLGGNWTNNGGTLTGSNDTLILTGNTKTIGGSSSTVFPVIQLGNASSGIVACTMNNANTCGGMIFYGNAVANTFTLAATLTLNGDLTVNQPTAAVTNNLLINAYICNISGNLNLPGTVTTASYIAKVTVTSGTLTVTGNVTWGNNATAANAVITVSTGSLTFGSAMTMASGTLSVTGTGTVTFNGASPSFTFGGANAPVFTTTAGCTVNIASGLVNNTNTLTLNATSNTYFTSNGTVTANAPITWGNVQFNGNDTLGAGSNLISIAGNLTLASGSAFNALQSLQLTGNWTNNGGTYTGANDTLTFVGNTKTIGGSASTTFQVVQFGNSGSGTVSYTMNNANTCSAMIFYGGALANTLTLTATLTITGDLTINQPAAAVTNNLLINAYACSIGGNLNLPGTTTSLNWIAKVTVTTGSLTVSGNVTWGNNTAAANAVITATTGTLTFNSSMTMASGTLSVTNTGTINFNGNTAPSFTFGGSNIPVFTTTLGCAINFKKGFTNNTNALTLIAGSNAYFTGNGAITPNANITFGNVQLDSLVLDTVNTGAGSAIVAGSFTLLYGANIEANQALEVRGNWVNNGGTISANANAMMMNGAAQTIGGTSTTTFPILQVGSASSAITVSCTINNNIICDSLVFHSYTVGRSLTIAVGNTLTVSGNVNMNQPTGAVSNTLAVNAGTCTVSGNLNYIGINNTTTHAAKVAVTSGSFSLTGNVNWMANTAIATEVISVTTGTLTFSKSLTMGTGSGTLTVSGAATVNFNGTTAPSFNFGGAATSPSFTTAAGCNLNFKNGFTNNSVGLTIKAGSNTFFTGSGAITPNASITFGNVQVNASFNDTLNSNAGTVIIAGNFTMASGSVFYAKKSFEVDGNWTNTSATLSGTVFTVFLNGTAQIVSGSPTTFQTLQIGNTTSVNALTTMNCNNTCSALIFHANTHNRTLKLSSGVTLTVNGNLTINQPTANSMTCLLEVATGTCNVTGNLVFAGVNTTTTRLAKIDVTSGSFNLTGTLTWGGNTATGDEIITVSTGTVTFSSDIVMGTKSGTMGITGSGIINFNGAAAPSFSFGGASAPVFTAVSGSFVNFKNGLTTNTTPLTFATGSNAVFTGTGTITPGASVTFGNIQNNTGYTLTLAGNISVTGNWVDSGTLVPSTYTVTLNGSGTQNVNRTSGAETFYGLTVSTSGAIINMLNNITVTNSLSMGGPNINMNGYTLTLGNNAGASLTYTGGIAYGGTWKRWLPVAAITSNSGSYYGLFPIGTSTDYRYVALNSTVNPVTAGYVSATHTNAIGITPVSYVDNGGSSIQEIANMHSDLTTGALAGGTYNITVHFTGFSTSGNVSDLKLETYTGAVMGSAGTHVTTVGPVSTPTMQRNGITASQIANTWVVGTNDKNATPLYGYYFSRKTGNWNDVSTGNGTWSFTPGGSGASCDCVPLSSSYVIIDSSHTVTANTSDSVQFIDINNSAALVNNAACTFVVVGDLTAYGSGTFTNNGTMKVLGAVTLSATNAATASGSVTVNSDFIMPNGSSYTQTGGTLTLNGNLTDSGTLAIAGGTINLNGSSTTISGTGVINDSAGTITITQHKTIPAGSTLTFGTVSGNTTLALTSGTSVNSSGIITLNGAMTGVAASSTWVNNAQSILSVTGAVLATGTMDAATAPNTVNYSGSVDQTIKAPLASYYNLTTSNAGTKALAAAVQTDNAVTISGSVILDEGTNALTGNASLNMSGTAQLKLQRSVAGTYPELAGIYSLPAGTVVVNQTADSASITSATYYNLTLNGSTPYDISGISTISSNLNVQATAALTNNTAVTVGGTFTHSSSAYSTLGDDVTASAMLISAGTLDDGGNNITVNGASGWTNNGGTFASSGQTIFYSKTSAAQTIGGSSATTFYDLVLDNPGGVTLNVSPAAATQVSAYLNLTAGNLITSSTNILKMMDTASVINGSASSYVSGPMEKLGSTDFIFPVGKSGVYGQAGVSGIIDGTTLVTAEYFPSSYSTLTPLAAGLSQVSHTEYWMIERTVTSDSLKVQLFWTNAGNSDLLDCNYLTIAHYMGGQWINEPATAVDSSVCTGSGSGSVQTTGYVTSFSPFTFGSSGGHSLPIKLITFDAVPQGAVVLTNWTTQIEVNNAYFTVEKSADGEHFNEAGRVQGAGNSTSALHYDFIDKTPFPGVSYYRLRQTDFNGQLSYSQIVPVNMPQGQGASAVTVYPNPAHGQVSVLITKPLGQIQLKVFDVSGWEVYAKTITPENSDSDQVITIPAGILAPGIYIVSTYTGKTESKIKLVVQ